MAKSPEMEEILEKLTKNLFGPFRTRKPIVTQAGGEFYIHYVCATCGKQVKPESDFRDQLSLKEFTISRMCQECQDSVFCSPEEDED